MTTPRTFLAEEGRKAVGELIANEKRHYLEPTMGLFSQMISTSL